MKFGIMQPYFFPYLGHFALIAAVDEWIVFDITQYTRRSWINRNRVLHPRSGWQYISVPLVHSSIHMRILEATVASPQAQEQYLLGKLSHYKRRAPHYLAVREIVRRSFAHRIDDRLTSLNVSGLRTVCDYLGLRFRYKICSELNLDYPANLRAGGWAPWISGRLGADVYVNPLAGRALFDAAAFEREGVELLFLQFDSSPYETPGYTFENDLSILDVLMWNSPAIVMRMLQESSRLVSSPGTDN